MRAANSAALRRGRTGQRRFRIPSSAPWPVPLRCQVALSTFRTESGCPSAVLARDPVHVMRRSRGSGRERSTPAVADRVRSARPEKNFYFDQMFRPIGQRNDVTDRRGLRGGWEFCALAGIASQHERSRAKQAQGPLWASASRFGGRLQRMVARSASGKAFSRCGSFS